MRPNIAKRPVVVIATAALLVAGCGGSTDSDDGPGSSAAAPTSTGIPEMPDQQAPPERLIVDVAIAGGEVTPTNEQLQTRVGVPIILRVASDAADELHVHSTPEHTFAVQPNVNQTFQFTVEVPGNVDVELHELRRTIVSISVRQ